MSTAAIPAAQIVTVLIDVVGFIAPSPSKAVLRTHFLAVSWTKFSE